MGVYIHYNPSLIEKARGNRRTPAPAESKLWFGVLQGRRLAGLRFTRQKPLDEYIVDFYCSELMVAIEIDGDSHGEQRDYDRQRTASLNRLGIEVIRYTNRDVMTNLPGVYEDLSKRMSDRRNQPP